MVAVEPSRTMIDQRPPQAAPVVQASAAELPFRDGTFDASLAILTIHHWPNWRRGVQELGRVARQRVVLLTWDPAAIGFWLVEDYFPEVRIERLLPARSSVEVKEIANMDTEYACEATSTRRAATDHPSTTAPPSGRSAALDACVPQK